MFSRQNSNNVMLCCIDIDVLLQSSMSCSNLFLMIVMAGSTGTDVNNAFTSQDIIHSPSSGVMFLSCSTKSCLFLMWWRNVLSVVRGC